MAVVIHHHAHTGSSESFFPVFKVKHRTWAPGRGCFQPEHQAAGRPCMHSVCSTAEALQLPERHQFSRWPPSPSLSSIFQQPGWQSLGRQRVASGLWTRPRSPQIWSLGQFESPEAPVEPPELTRGSGLEPSRTHARLASTRGPGARPAQ